MAANNRRIIVNNESHMGALNCVCAYSITCMLKCMYAMRLSTIVLYRENAIAIESEASDPNGDSIKSGSTCSGVTV